MKQLLALFFFLLSSTAMAQPGGSVVPIRNLLPECSATSGRCPYHRYYCEQDNAILICSNPNTWTSVAGGSIASGSTLPATCAAGDLFQKTNAATGQQLYACESTNTWVAQGGGASTIDGLEDVTLSETPLSGDILVYGASDIFRNKPMSGDATITSEGVVAVAANAVALTTDTTGNYVASATANGGLTLTGTEAGSLGMLASCASGEILKWNGTAWACAADAGAAAGSSDVGTVGTCTTDPCFTATAHTITEGIFWEGATANDFETGIAATDPTADRTITLPNESGTVCTTGSVCTGYQSVLTNIAGLEATLSGTPNVIIATEIDTLSEIDTIVADAVFVTEASTQTMSGTKTFSASPIISSTAPTVIWKDSQATDGDNNVTIASNCTDTGSGTEDCDITINQQIAGTLTTRITIDADGQIFIDGATDAIQMRIQAHATQTAAVFRIEDSSADDIFQCTTSACTVGDIAGDGNYGIEFINNTSTVADPASNSTMLGFVGNEIVTRADGASAGVKIPRTQTTTCILENLDGADDDYPCGGTAPYAITITGVGCRCRSNCGTLATITLEDLGGNDVVTSPTAVTCVSSPTAITYTAPSSGNTFTAAEGVQFDTVADPTDNGIYEISYTWTAN